MLDANHGQSLTETMWASAVSYAGTPDDPPFQRASGPMLDDCLSRRTYQRFLVSRRAILVHGRDTHGVYVKDMSKGGVGFYSPFQLFPNGAGWLLLPDGDKKLQFRVRRCRRRGPNCYEIGAQFIGGDHILPGDMHELMGYGI